MTVTDAGLDRAIGTVLDDCFAVRPDEHVLVVGDPATRDLAEALWQGSRSRGAEAVLLLIEERLDGEPARPVAGAMAAADVFIVATRQSLSHMNARKEATARGARGATLPGVTAAMLTRAMAVDLPALRARGIAAAELFTQAGTAHLTCPNGTDMWFRIGGRQGIADDGDLTAPQAFGNLPCGEAAISPETGHGRIAASSVTPAGILPEPMLLTVEDGQLTDATGPHGGAFLELLRSHGRLGTNLAELGVGTNDGAAFTGNVLEDEKVLGTAHVAFGASDAFGGSVYVPIHRDVVIVDPTLDVDGVRVLDAGRWLLDAAPTSAGGAR
ncbi:aminopeptidase [Jiangella muralis]|uniref:aminopeptidase n=1 Tax=Jiangella muralis TaxID=702383 RepID=UPI00069EDA98|nr:hypothetical protein [Jiangella muralis]